MIQSPHESLEALVADGTVGIHRPGHLGNRLGILAGYLIGFILLSVPSTSYAAIAFDTQSTTYNGSNVASVSTSGTASAAGEIAVITTMPGGNVGDTITGCTVGGTAATAVNKVQIPGVAQFLYIYYFLNPPTSATTYTCSQSGSSDMQITVGFYSNANQSGQPDSSNTATGAGGISINLTTVADSSWLISISRGSSCGLPGAGTGTTIRDPGTGIFRFGDSNGAKSPAGTYSMQWSPCSGNQAIAGISISPSATVAAPVKVPDILWWGWNSLGL